MKYLMISLSSCFFLLLTGCKKNSTPKDEISFTYNGRTYFHDSKDRLHSINVSYGYSGAPSLKVSINLPNLDGTVTFERTGCAFYLPKAVRLNNFSPGCVISYSSVAPGTPIDSSKIYQYSSGSLNLTSSNCTSSSFVFLGITLYSTYCDVNGTFDLTLTNRNNEKIVITNGIVRLHSKSL